MSLEQRPRETLFQLPNHCQSSNTDPKDPRSPILFDNAGVGHNSGYVDDNITDMAAYIIELLDLLKVKELAS